MKILAFETSAKAASVALMENAVYVTIYKTGEESRRIGIEGGEKIADLSL